MMLFVALPLPEDAQRRLWEVSLGLQERWPAKYVSAENYHVTLAYLGEHAADDELSSILRQTAAECAGFSLEIAGLGCFAKGLLYAAVQPTAPLMALAGALRSRLDRAAIPYQPPNFTPHITLARKIDEAAANADANPPFTVDIDRIVLFESKLVDAKRRYLPVLTEQLGGNL